METNVFPFESIQKRFAKMQQVRLYTDDETEGPQNLKFKFELTGTVAIPTYVIVDPKSEKKSGSADRIKKSFSVSLI